ncbi:hypothetical protein DXT63_09795 [Thermoanaerobacteraceae bacterium SP2]|nr:hypothetical protein DXT63_09795 [Thermoanaerobacteraceae bacterium SP2]
MKKYFYYLLIIFPTYPYSGYVLFYNKIIRMSQLKKVSIKNTISRSLDFYGEFYQKKDYIIREIVF